MYLSNSLGGFGKVLKGSDVNKILKQIDIENAAIAKDPNSAMSQRRKVSLVSLRARLDQLQPPAPVAPVPVMLPPPVTSSPKTDPTTYTGVTPDPISIAPLPAAVQMTNLVPVAAPLAPAPDAFANFGPAPATSEPAPAASSSMLPILLGVGALAAFFMLKKKRS